MSKIKHEMGLQFLKTTVVFIFCFFLTNCTPPPPIGPLPEKSPDSFRIAFGSCNKTFLPQPLWEPIMATQSDLWMWLGDIVYGDRGGVDTLRWMYAYQKSLPGYAALRKQIPVVGVWDDHDYGVNDGGIEYEHKEETQRMLLDFLDEPADSPRRLQEGVYTSYRFVKNDTRIKLILLDERSFREEARAGKDILGEKQWQWLHEELFSDTAEVTLIASSSQVIPNDNYAFNEVWQDYPASREKLLSWLNDVSGTV
ncbi:MAG TPA: alkaline phosphatase D family protein, partial [bacterium]|nr:alkaline phosphatase D family protein [bacterium]